MARLRISRAAQADLSTILTTSLEHWGEPGRARYAALLAAAMRRAAADPQGPTTKARFELAPGIRSFHIRHVRRGHGGGEIRTGVDRQESRIGAATRLPTCIWSHRLGQEIVNSATALRHAATPRG